MVRTSSRLHQCVAHGLKSRGAVEVTALIMSPALRYASLSWAGSVMDLQRTMMFGLPGQSRVSSVSGFGTTLLAQEPRDIRFALRQEVEV